MILEDKEHKLGLELIASIKNHFCEIKDYLPHEQLASIISSLITVLMAVFDTYVDEKDINERFKAVDIIAEAMKKIIEHNNENYIQNLDS